MEIDLQLAAAFFYLAIGVIILTGALVVYNLRKNQFRKK